MQMFKGYLLLVGIAPINSKFDGAALVIAPHRPVVLQWHQTPCKEVIVPGLHQQCERVAC